MAVEMSKLRANEYMRSVLDSTNFYERSVISGYQLFVVKTKDDYEEYDLDRPPIERETLGVFPAIFMNVTYRIDKAPPDVAAIEPLVVGNRFRHLLTESDAQ